MGVFILLATGTFAQKGTYTVFDSSVIPSKHMAQQNEFWNNTYNFPAKPRNMWEIGISGGMQTINGDVPAEALKSWGASFHIRKAMGYLFSMRLQGTYGVAKGQDWGASSGWANNSAWTSTGYTRGDNVFYNYRTKIWDVQLQGLFTLNNILFHKAKTSWIMYAGLGAGVTGFHAMINALDANGKNYASFWNTFTATDMLYTNRKSTRDKLKAGMDNTYETEAETQGVSRQKKDNSTMKPSVSLIGGFQFKLSKRINLAIEDKLTVVHTDLLDGQRWQEHAGSDPVLTPNDDTYNYVSIGLNFNIGNKKKNVEPLYWINPLDYVYSEVNIPHHMKIPKPVLDDADNDGVTDQFDQCPNTPAGVKVDTHGCPLDTDGDGVPDYKDKELITPTYCQPVDADGVGKCPPPACCADLEAKLKAQPVAPKCDIGSLPSITFKGKGVSALSKDQKTMLATVASKLKSNADCAITVTGHPATSKASQSLCNKRVEAIKKQLVEKEGISADRITTSCEPSATGNDTIDISGSAK